MIDLRTVRWLASKSDARTRDALKQCACELERSRDTIVMLEAELSTTRRERDGAIQIARRAWGEAQQLIRALAGVHRALGGRKGESAVRAAKRVANTMRECLAWTGVGSAN